MLSTRNRHLWMSAGLFALMIRVDIAEAQLTDITQTPNVENAGIVKSLQQQIGAGVGNIMTPGSSTFIMARDPARSADVGEALFALAAVQNSSGNSAGARISIQRAVEALANALGREHRLTAAALELQRSIGT